MQRKMRKLDFFCHFPVCVSNTEAVLRLVRAADRLKAEASCMLQLLKYYQENILNVFKSKRTEM